MSRQEASLYSKTMSTTDINSGESMLSNKRRKTVETEITTRPLDQFQLLDFGHDFNVVSNPNQDFALDATIPQDFLNFFSDNNPAMGDAMPSVMSNSTENGPLSMHNNFMPVLPTQTTLPSAPSSSSATSSPIHQEEDDQRQIRSRQMAVEQDPPNQAVFTLIVGGKVFRLSWESLKSDGPDNFFLDYFRKKKSKVMHIDRDPDIFELIVRHLRGYYIQPEDDIQNQSLIYDASYYGLQRLKKILDNFLYLNVGGRVFRLPWELLKRDGSKNFFTGPLRHSLLSPHTEEGANNTPVYIDRDPDIFEDIVNHLRGYTIHIRDEMHRKNLLRDAQYYVLRQLTDKLLIAQQAVAGFGDTTNLEVLLLLQDIRLFNLLPPEDAKHYRLSDMNTIKSWHATQLHYKRLADSPPHALLVQVADMTLHLHKRDSQIKLTFDMKEQDMNKMKSIASKIHVSQVNQEIYLDQHCAITIDDHQQVQSLQDCLDHDMIETDWKVCQQCLFGCQRSSFILERAICSIHEIQDMLTLNALRLEAIGSKFRLNLKRQFLKS
ncbi:hypothetical protein A0J61_08781 [Choanephora cucurbitarum]|uniref:BTB domain-containing protein n=1 Tax=Choanephora cucurbitarum TaxID=101091 RepID=A0A1C7N2G4_9FUNG|nr:hypothetical protein A0J61_08781 [Choanephora cucurbitarum]